MSHFTRTIFPAVLSCAAVGLGLLATSSASAQTVLASSAFPVSNEGWTSIGVAGSTPAAHTPLIFGSTAGGNILNAAGSGNFAFGAPSEFLGNQSAAIGGTLSFRIYDGSPTAGQDGSVRLMGRAIELQSPQSSTPGLWTSFELSLRPGIWWVGDPSAGVLATAADLRNVLSNLEALSIFGGNQVGELATRLDDVVLTSAVPEPGTWAMWAAGLGFLAAMGRRRQAGGGDGARR